MTTLADYGPSTRRSSLTLSPGLLPLLGLVATVALWSLLTDVLFASRPLVTQFSPARAVAGLVELTRSGTLLDGASASVFRLLIGLLIAALFGVGGGLLLGYAHRLDRAIAPVRLFARMVSPLSWAPIAIIAFGIGDPPVIALIAATAVWPILATTMEGVSRVNPDQVHLARTLGATRGEILSRVVLPSIQRPVLSGIRQSIGVAWVVLVPAEMLGVTSGLGYLILNAKDQLAYHHITALIIVIGTIGYAIDAVTGWLLSTRRERSLRSR